MEEELLTARFESLLKRYREKLDLLDLDLPSGKEAPPAPPLPAWETPVLQDQPPTPEPEPARPEPAAPPLPAWEAPVMEERPPLPRPRGPARAPEPQAPAAPQPRAGRKPLVLAAAALAAASAVLWWGYERVSQPPDYRQFSLARTANRGLAWRDGRVAVADSEDRFLLLFDADGRRVDTKESIDSEGLADLCWADGAFWSTASGRSAIFQHDAGPAHPARRIYATPSRLPAALAGDNENLWAAEAKAPVVYRYLIGHSLNGVSLTPLNQYNLPGAPAAGLYSSDGRLWVLDSQSRRLTRYRYDAGTLSPEDSMDLGARLPAEASVAGMTAGGDFLWVLTAEPAVLHRFSLAALRWRPAAP